MKIIIFMILSVLYCGPVYAMAGRPGHPCCEDVSIWVMIPDEDDILVLSTSVESVQGGGLDFKLEDRGIYVEQNIAASATPPALLAKRIGDIIDAYLIIYLDFENGDDKFETIGKIMKMEGY